MTPRINPTSLGEPNPIHPTPGPFDDPWLSDLSNDLGCFGLCSEAEEPHSPRLDLEHFGLVDPKVLRPVGATRPHRHEEVGF